MNSFSRYKNCEGRKNEDRREKDLIGISLVFQGDVTLSSTLC